MLIAIEQLSDRKLIYSCSLGLFPFTIRSSFSRTFFLHVPVCHPFAVAHLHVSLFKRLIVLQTASNPILEKKCTADNTRLYSRESYINRID